MLHHALAVDQKQSPERGTAIRPQRVVILGDGFVDVGDVRTGLAPDVAVKQFGLPVFADNPARIRVTDRRV